MSAETHPLLSPHSFHNYSQLDHSDRQAHVSLDVHSEAAGSAARPASSSPRASLRNQPVARPGAEARLPPGTVRRPVSLSEYCCGCVLSFARFIGSSRWLWLSSSLYFLAHLSVSLYTLLAYFPEHCTYDYHYLLLVYCLRSLLALRIVWWQTAAEEAGGQQAAEPGTFDRFLKNWMDMIALIYAAMWALAPRDCLDTAPHQFAVCTAFVCLSYAALACRLALYLSLTRLSLPDTAFILLRSLQKNLNAGSAFTGPLTESAHVVRMSEVSGVRRVVYEGLGVGEAGQWAEEDCVCCVCLQAYVEGEDIRVLSCAHHSHSKCIDRWLQEKRRCPLCNQHI